MTDRFRTLLAAWVSEHGRFSHTAQLYMGWWLLEDTSVLKALADFDTGVQALAGPSGQADRHDAVLPTACFLLLLERREADQTWQDFAARNAGLLDWTQRDRLLNAFHDAALQSWPHARHS